MSKYLDVSGLTYLWEKIKEALTGKQNTLTGTEKQLVTFDETTGDAKAVGMGRAFMHGALFDSKDYIGNMGDIDFLHRYMIYMRDDSLGATDSYDTYSINLIGLSQWLNNRRNSVAAPDTTTDDLVINKARAIGLSTRLSSTTIPNGHIDLIYDVG